MGIDRKESDLSRSVRYPASPHQASIVCIRRIGVRADVAMRGGLRARAGEPLWRRLSYAPSGMAIGRSGAPVAPQRGSGMPMNANSLTFSAASASRFTTSMIGVPVVANM